MPGGHLTTSATAALARDVALRMAFEERLRFDGDTFMDGALPKATGNLRLFPCSQRSSSKSGSCGGCLKIEAILRAEIMKARVFETLLILQR